ncbi:hypothetical protein [Pelotalea chapellei]|uniref:Nucleic acid-binding protein n=1 Tax=Pelotalea chapellei TaxID=44671 RepID=A0ABS5U4X0_9BACT|nr:hypothetical protein [Pelotalea chapellei]MBT1070703.1 hypothetical protein [Pelotalea chapellei]
MPTYLIDTNVMLAASAYHSPLSALVDEAEPKEPVYRELIYNRLREFDLSDDSVLMDEECLIRDEYEKNMAFNSHMRDQEYGFQVLQYKQDRGLVKYVPIDVDSSSGEPIGVLSADLTAIVFDTDDRKWVASAVSAMDYLGIKCPILYGAESDWYMIKDELLKYDIQCDHLLPDAWYINKISGT